MTAAGHRGQGRGRGWRALPLGVRLLVLALLWGLVLGGVEGLARRSSPQLPVWQGTQQQGTLMEGHPTRLWGMPPGVQPNAGTTATINARGLRGVLPEVPRPAGRARIVLLGDSSFFGHGVGDDETLTVRLEARLRAQGLDVDAVNLAVAGYSVAQSTLLMEEEGWALEPTLLLLANVWSDNTWDAFHDEDLLRSRRAARLNPLVHSAAMRLLLSRMPRPEDRLIVVRPDDVWPTSRVRRVPLDRFSTLTDDLIRAAAARGAGAVLIKPTNTTLLSADQTEHRGWDPYFQVFDALGTCHHIPVVDLTPPFRAHPSAQSLFLDRMHPTPTGQDIMAAAIETALRTAGWPDTPLRSDPSRPCDTRHIQDIPAPSWFSDSNTSPQSNLFPPSSAPPPPPTPPPPPRSVGHF